VRLLQEGLARLPENERAHIATRAAQQIAAIESAYPALKSSASLDSWSDAQIDRIVDAFHDARCPALRDGEQCSLYDYRPLACRSMGIPPRERDIVNGACAVQTFLPIVRLPESLASEEEALARQESAELARLPEVAAQGEELLNPYGFLSSDAEREHGTAFDSDH
jgi:Fe-S-cluster containining protein